MKPSNLNTIFYDKNSKRLYLQLMKPSKILSKEKIELKKNELFTNHKNLTFELNGKKHTIVESWQSNHFVNDKSFLMNFRSPVGTWFIGLTI